MSNTNGPSASGGEGQPVRARSLEEVNRSVTIPPTRWWRRLIAFMGPAYMVSVGYMDPGNWATDLAGGSQFGYTLIWVLAMSNLMAILLQTLSARLGLVTGRDLAQACREEYPNAVRYILFGLCEVAIAACDLAEVIGTAIGLNLLLGIPVFWGVLITGADVLLLLMMQRFGIRKIEAFIILLVAMIGACFIAEVFLSKPSVSGVLGGFVPHTLSGGELYIAIGILGATVMPHNLYLHSALVQSRDVSRSRLSVAQACKFNLIDSIVALNGAFLINAAILIVAAATFYEHKIIVDDFAQAPVLLQNLLGSDVAKYAFALGLLCAGQSSTVTGTLAGQITMEGFLNFRMRAWLRRLLTRLLAITPAIIAVALTGEKGLYKLLILSQVVLSLQLSFAVVPLVKFTSSKIKMGPFANKRWVWATAWLVTLIIISLNGKLAYEQLADWVSAAGSLSWLVQAGVLPGTGLLGGLLVWMIFKGERPPRPATIVDADDVALAAIGQHKRYRRIGVALEAKQADATMLAEAVAMAKSHRAELVLMHVVEGVGGQWYGAQTGDEESREDENYLKNLAGRLGRDLAAEGISVRASLGFGAMPSALIKLAQHEEIDLMIVGGHGHRAVADIIRGETIDHVRHALKVPVMAIRNERA